MKDQRKTEKERECELVEPRQCLARLEGERTMAESSLPTVAERWRAIMESFDGLIYVCSQDFRIEFMNKRFIQRTGFDATGTFCYRALHNLDSPCPWCVNDRVFRGETVRWEVRSPKDDRWYYAMNTPIQHSDGRMSKWAMILDITERKQVEEALRQSEARYRGLFEGLPVGLYRTTPAGKIMDANEALVETLGYPDRDSLLAVHVADLYVDPADRRRWQALMRAEGVVHGFEVQLRRTDGTSIWVVDTARMVQRPDGEIHYEGCVVDITRRKGAEEALQKAKEDLERRVEKRTGELSTANDRLRREIEERARAEQELRFQRANLENLIDNAPEAIAILDQDDRVMRINREFTRVFGYTADEAVGHVINELIVPSELTAEGNQFYRTLKAGGTIDTETLRRRKDGTLAPVSVLAMLIHGENGRAEICAIYRDITEHKRAEDALRESEATLQAILSASPVGISLVRGRTLAWANKTIYDMMGYEIGSLEGKSARVLYPTEEEFERVGRELYAPIKAGGVGRTETVLARANGSKIHCRLQASPLDHSDLSRGVIVAAMDITDLKLAGEALRQSEAKYRTLLEQIPAVTYTAALDEESSTLYVSPQIEALIGFSQADYGADPGIWRKQVHPEDGEWVLREVHRARDQGEALCMEYRMLTRKGKVIWVRDEGLVVRDDSGRPLFLQGIMFDVTARKVAEDEVNLYQRQLRTLASELLFTEERERRRLATDLHDSIGQALAISKLKLDALKTAVLSSPLALDLEEISALLDGTIQQTRSLTFELSPPVLYELGLVPALESLVEQMERRYNLRIQFVEDGRPKPVSEDLAVLLFRTVQELLVNVVKHANSQKARVAVIRDRARLRIRVEDNGIGFDPAEIDSHEDRARRFGLFSIKERLHHLGGKVEIESSPGKGTQVSLTAPLEQKKERRR